MFGMRQGVFPEFFYENPYENPHRGEALQMSFVFRSVFSVACLSQTSLKCSLDLSGSPGCCKYLIHHGVFGRTDSNQYQHLIFTQEEQEEEAKASLNYNLPINYIIVSLYPKSPILSKT